MSFRDASRMMASIVYARNKVTSDDYSPAVGVINWIMMCSTVLSVCARLGMKLVVTRELNLDDLVISCAMLFSVGQSISLAVLNSNGLGMHQDTLTPSKIISYSKAAYASDLLFIINLALSKSSTLLLLRQITPVKLHRRVALGTIIFIALWAVVGIFASAFQCTPPNTWEIMGPNCFDRVAFWTYFGVTNIMTEAVVIGLPLAFLWEVQISRKQRWIIFGCFGVRVSIIGAAIAQLFFLHHNKASPDVDRWPYYICMILVQNLSVITACVPFVKNFILGLDSGMIRIGNKEDRRKMSAADYLSSGIHQGPHYSKQKASVANGTTQRLPKEEDQDDLNMELREIDNMRPEPINNRTTIYTVPGRPETGSGSSYEGRIKAITEISVSHGG